MRAFLITTAVLVSALVLLLCCASCGGSQPATSATLDALEQAGAAPLTAQWPQGLPQDGVQPWETLGGNGTVLPSERGASTINLDSEFVAGVDYYSQGGTTNDANGVLTIDSGSAGSGATSFAIYRVVLGGQAPGALGVDINLRNRSNASPSAYYIGLADYAAGAWKWYGPFTDGQVRLSMNDGMLSSLGNAFVAVVAHDGADFDVVGLGVNTADSGDTTAPPVPGAPTVTPVDGGLLLEWLPVIAGDLAGYRIYYSNSPLVDQFSPGVQEAGYLEGNTRHLLTGLTQETYVRLSAVDISGNESAVSALASDEPLAGAPGELEVTVDAAIGLLGDTFSLTASGADEYDFDLDGDGIFEITGTANGNQVFNADAAGILRPAVRGTSGTAVALGAVSLVISGNSRPLARLYAEPAEGAAPLTVTFTSEGEDYDGTIEEYAWDFEGDGIYDQTSANPVLPPKVYAESGLFNAKLRVTDNHGATDVDTVAIHARKVIGFNNFYVDTDVFGEMWLSSALIDGHPAVTYFDTEHGYLQYRRALDASGYSWGPAVDLTAVTSDGYSSNLAMIAGRPAVVWMDGNTSTIKYLIADDAQGTSWSLTPVIVGPNPSGTSYRIAITVVANNPAVAWHDSTGGNLHYRRASSPAGTGATAADWGDPVAVIDATGQVNGNPELAVVNGNPAVTYYNGGASSIYFKRAVTNTGALVGDWPAMAVDCTPTLDPVQYSNLLVVNGNPAISFIDPTNLSWSYMRALDANGATWPAGPVVVSPTGCAMFSSDMQLVRGRPAMAYRLSLGGVSVWYSRALDANGSTWSSSIPVNDDASASPGDYLTMFANNGQPNAIYTVGVPQGIEIGVPKFE